MTRWVAEPLGSNSVETVGLGGGTGERSPARGWNVNWYCAGMGAAE